MAYLDLHSIHDKLLKSSSLISPQVHDNFIVFQEDQKSSENEKQRLAKIATMSIKMIHELSGNLLRKVCFAKSIVKAL